MTGLTCEKHPHGSVSITEPKLFEDALLGIPVVLSGGVKQTVCDECGTVLSTRIADLEGLIAAAAASRVKHPLKLTGGEIRFLRKSLNMTAKELAAELEVTAETISRWENDREPIGPASEKFLRLIVADIMAGNAPAVDYDPAKILHMKIQAVRPHGEELVLHMERVVFKMPREPKTPQWDEQGEKDAA